MVFTTTEFWMFGIIGLMLLFGVFAGLFSKFSKDKE